MKKFAYIFRLAALPGLILAGCGTGVGVEGSGSSVQASQECISCHERSNHAFIVASWKASRHALTNTAGCVDCHLSTPDHASTSSCSSCHGGGGSAPPLVSRDANARCYACHDNGAVKQLDRSHLPNLVFSQVTSIRQSSGELANYLKTLGFVTSRGTPNETLCSFCHDPHNNTLTSHFREWALSRKSGNETRPSIINPFGDTVSIGEIMSPAHLKYDFKSRDDCNRCHTTTGFKKYLATGDSSKWAPVNSPDITKESIRCDACHEAYNLKAKRLPPVTAKYAGNRSPVTYPDVGLSNTCMYCHVGRENGQTVALASFNSYTGASFVNTHYLTAGATIFSESGYEFSGRDYSPYSRYQHKDIGVTNVGNTGRDKGPCVWCHITAQGNSMRFMPGVVDAEGKIVAVTRTCTQACHSSANPMTVEVLEEEDEGYKAALACLKAMLEENRFRPLFFYPESSYFFRDQNGNGYLDPNEVPPTGGARNVIRSNKIRNVPSSAKAQRTWRPLETTDGVPILPGSDFSAYTTATRNNMGAAMNYNLLIHDPGGFAHNRMYVKRLIYDSIDWLYDNDLARITNPDPLKTDVEAAIRSLTFSKGPGGGAVHPITYKEFTNKNEELDRIRNLAIEYLITGSGGLRTRGLR